MKRIFVNVFVNNQLHHNKCAIDIDANSDGIKEAGELCVDIARGNNFPIEVMRFEIVE